MIVRFTGELHSHTMPWKSAEHFLASGREAREGSYYPLLAATVFTYFAVEAFLNGLLRDIAPDGYANERELFGRGKARYHGTRGKYRFLVRLCELKFDNAHRQYESLANLERARNRMVHARTEAVDYTADVSLDNLAGGVRLAFVELADVGLVATTMADVKYLCDQLCLAARRKYGNIGVGGDSGAFAGTDGWLHASEVA